jgi:Ras-related protein Rab-18
VSPEASTTVQLHLYGDMASEDALPVLKVLVIGPSGAGKSARRFGLVAARQKDCLTPGPQVLCRYCDDQFDPESSAATIGIDFKVSSRPRRH